MSRIKEQLIKFGFDFFTQSKGEGSYQSEFDANT